MEPRIHPSWIKLGGLPLEIMQGKHDDDLENIRQAVTARIKSRFQRGQRVVLKGTRNVELDGQEVTIIKVNQKSITVGVGKRDQFGYEKEYNVPPKMLAPLSD